ncbi:MAG: hypothetical protein AB8H86_09425 [Polyangiales bacterium]
MRVLLLLLTTCECVAPTARHAAMDEARPASTPTAALAAEVQRGMCLAHSWESGGEHGYGSDTSAATLDELKELGVEWVSLTPFGFMASLQSESVEHVGDRRGGERDAQVRAEIRAARDRGIQTLLKPHIWVGRGEWRAELEPGDWHAWFQSYREWILIYARIAEEESVPLLAIGTELRSSAQHAHEWRALIEEIRAVYSGELTYCANWDSVDDVLFWDAVDYIGVQFYPPLASAPGDSAEAMGERLRGHLAGLERISVRFERPVLLTEVGYKATEDTAVRPYEWTERSDSPVDEAAQAQAYEILFRQVASERWIRGVYIWKWFTNPSSLEEGPRGFSPRGKPAEDVLRRAFRQP